MVSASSTRPKISPTRKAILVGVGLSLIVPAVIGGSVAKGNGHPAADPWGAWFVAGWFYMILLGAVFGASELNLSRNLRRSAILVAAIGLFYCVGRVLSFYALGYP